MILLMMLLFNAHAEKAAAPSAPAAALVFVATHNVVDAAAPSTAPPPAPAPALPAATFILMYTLISLIRIGRVA